MTCPCYKCEKRSPGCHGKCEHFKAWRAPLDSMREEKTRRRKMDEVVRDGSERRRKWIRNHGFIK